MQVFRTCASLLGLLLLACGGPEQPAQVPQGAESTPDGIVTGDADAKPSTLADRYGSVVARIQAEAAKTQPLARLEELCSQFPKRLSGSAGLAGAVIWAERSLQQSGHENVRVQLVQVPKWVRGAESLTVVGSGEALSIIGLGGTAATPEGGLTGEVLVVTSFDELQTKAEHVKGRVVMFDVKMKLDEKTHFPNYGDLVPYRIGGPDAAARLGAKAVLIRSLTTDPKSPPHTGTLHYSGEVPVIPAAALSWEAADRVVALSQKAHVNIKLDLQNTDEGLVPSGNVIAELRGAEMPDEVVVFGGHIDAWDVGQGAQDNGAGVVIGMEVLSLLRQMDLRPRRTLRLVLWTNEENGERGARVYADALGGETHVAALETDSGAAPLAMLSLQTQPRGEEVAAPQGLGLLSQVVDVLRPQGVQTGLPFFAGADVQPLVAMGIPGVGLFHDPTHYFDVHHSEADVLAAVDPAALKQSVSVTAATVYLLADMSEQLGTHE